MDAAEIVAAVWLLGVLSTGIVLMAVFAPVALAVTGIIAGALVVVVATVIAFVVLFDL